MSDLEKAAIESSIDFHEYENHYFIIAFQRGAKWRLDQASAGFEEWFKEYLDKYKDEFSRPEISQHKPKYLKGYQAARLNTEKELERYKKIAKNRDEMVEMITEKNKEIQQLREDLNWALNERQKLRFKGLF